MYNHISGVLDSRTASEVVVEAHGVGYILRIPESTGSALPQPGQRLTLLAYLHVTDDAHTLYGFATAPEREFFLQLMTVNGVGPKLALAVLSGGRVQDIQQAIRLGDFASLKRIKGVGENTAKKIVLALGKILIHQPPADPAATGRKENGEAVKRSSAIAPGLDEDTDAAVKVVCQLQEVSPDVALQAVQRAWSELSAESKGRPIVQDVVRRAMKYTD